MRTSEGYLVRPHRQWDKRAAVEKGPQKERNDESQQSVPALIVPLVVVLVSQLRLVLPYFLC